MNRSQFKAILTFCFSSSLLLSGCSNDMSELQAELDQIKQTPAGTIEPIPEVRIYEKYTYKSGLLRSPFMPPESGNTSDSQGSTTEGPKPDVNRNKDFLEQFPLDSLAMVGTISKDRVDYALVLTTDGIIHQVRSGDYMGQNDGRVLAVSETGVQLKELVPDGLGGYVYRDNELLLAEPDSS